MRFERPREFVRTLRFRIVAWNTLIIFLMLAVTMIVVRDVVRRAIQHEFDAVLRDDLAAIGSAIRKDYPDRKPQLLDSLEQKAQEHTYRQWFVQLFDQRSRPLWSSGNAPELPDTLLRALPKDALDVDRYRVLDARVDTPAGPIYVRLGSSRQAMDEDFSLLNRIMLLASGSILLLAPVGGLVIAGRATRPIAWIIATAARLHPAKLDERLPIRGTGDELDQLSKTINGMLDRIASYLEQNREFVANAAHELRSPLAAIRSSVEVALNRNRSPEEYVTLMLDVMEECGRLGSLVNRLLLLAEGDAGRFGGADQTTRLDKIVRESAEMFGAVAEAKGVRLVVGDLPKAFVRGEEDHLRQVVRNLLDNAIKFSKEPSEIRVRLSVDQAKRLVLLVVQDQGIGMEADAIPRIFDRFYRADKARNRDAGRGGNGLGLSICRSVVAALQGEIRVESELGKGSTFFVTLPLAPDPLATMSMRPVN